MSVFEESPWAPHMLGILRIVAGLMFFTFGSGKLFGFPSSGTEEPIELMSLVGIAGILEVFGAWR